jgi:hypothetical protein
MYNETKPLPSLDPPDEENIRVSVNNTSTPNLTETDLRFLDPPSWNKESHGCKTGYYILDERKYCNKHLVPYTSSGKCPFC